MLLAMVSAKLPVTYWSDPLCIWAYVGQARLDAMLREFGDLVEIRHRVVPVFGSVPWRFAEGSWAEKGPAGRVEATRAVAERFGHTEVDGRVWELDPPASSWAPSAAVKAVFVMADRGEVSQEAARCYQWEIRRALFAHNRNVARRSVQLEVAEQQEVPRAPLEEMLDDGSAVAMVWRDHHDRETAQVKGSPTYVFDGGREMLYGNVPLTVIRATVEAVREGIFGGSDC